MVPISAVSPTSRDFAAPRGTSTSAQADPAEQRQLRELQETDRKVRAHEAAHLAAAGGLAQGGASFTMTRGSDGRYYATGGEVSISTSEGRSPQDTLARARQIRAAALAPADPSPQDYRVAAQATRMEFQAQQELVAQQSEATADEQGSARVTGQVAPDDEGVAQGVAAAYGERSTPGALLDLFA